MLIKFILAVFCISILSGCVPPEMTNDAIIKEVKKCTDAGLSVSVCRVSGSGHIYNIECLPKEYQGDKRGTK